jgi:hypothetical protein
VDPGEEPGDLRERYKWRVFSGPQGLAVNPCEPGPFTWISDADAPIVNGTDFAHPPFPPTLGKGGDDRLRYHEENCLIKSMGQDEPPTFECGNTLVVDFEKDAQFDDPEMKCEDGFRYRRGWTVEY